MNAAIRATLTASLMAAVDEFVEHVHALDEESINAELVRAELRVTGALIQQILNSLMSDGGAEAECIACGKRFSGAEGHPTVSLGPCCWRGSP